MSSFANEWATFSDISGQDDIFDDYFRIFPWHLLDEAPIGLDFGCGNGRWAAKVAPRVLSDLTRRVICHLPHPLRLAITTTIAALIYKPLSYTTILPYYRDKSFYIMRNDAYDRFSTKLEKRFTREEVQTMLEEAGFHSIEFSNRRPYWCAMGIKT